MRLRCSDFVHLLPLTDPIVLVVHAMAQTRITVTPQVAQLIHRFDRPADPDELLPALARDFNHPEATLRTCITMLCDHGILTAQSREQEHATLAQQLAPLHGRDPTELLDRYRRSRHQGAQPYWAVERPRDLAPAPTRRRIDVLLFGDCDIQMETDFLRQEAASRGIDLRIAASFPTDTALAGDRTHDAIIIGALQTRHAISLGEPRHHNNDPALVYTDAARRLLTRLRAVSNAPTLLDALPEPTLQPLGFADRGPYSHRNRFRHTNLQLERVAEEFPDVYITDVPSALACSGAATLLDDGLTSFTHFGSPGWMLQRPEPERLAVHNLFPDIQPLADALAGDPYGREAAMARAHMDALTVVLGLDRKKCVIVDLDGVLWPGVLAETGAPFAWWPEVSSPHSYVGLYFGIHEALLALKRRGLLLACVSKNDEATIRQLWNYPPHYPQSRLLTLDSFVTHRINWQDKAANIRSIMSELGFADDAFMFIDDNPRERERVHQSLPDVAVLGDDLFSLRRTLLTDPRLQPLRITPETSARTELVRAQLERSRLHAELADEASFLASLEIVRTVAQITDPTDAAILERVRELFERTTQYNTTGIKFSAAELRALIATPESRLYVLHMRDRLADHGLVGAAIMVNSEIVNFVLSCRVIGLHGESALLDRILKDATNPLHARIVPTSRNLPVRNLYRDHGFTEDPQGTWVSGDGKSATPQMKCQNQPTISNNN
jgi:FkbH-like protein